MRSRVGKFAEALADNLLPLAALIAAGCVAAFGQDGWGWFLFIAWILK